MAPAGVGRRPHNLPFELTSFVGRRLELTEVKRLLGTTRLLTLTGSGGAGKTRLAVRAAEEMARGFSDGVWFVDLAPLDNPMLVNQAVFGALGLQDRSSRWSVSTLTDYLGDKRLLLVFDNCEHLLDASAVLVDTLLRSCPNLRVLATSREALGTVGEVRMRVPSMSLPADGALTAQAVIASDAVALFEARAMAVVPEFRVAAANVEAVTTVCRRLDGMPLALELAAVRLDTLSVEQLAHGLDSSLDILGEGIRGQVNRHGTLQATIDWSYHLLGDAERLLWARLSVFAGGFDADAAAQVTGDSSLPATSVRGLLSGLVAKSIVQREHVENVARYRVLETLRQYGRGRLQQSGDEVVVRRRHLAWVAELAAATSALNVDQGEAFDRVQLDLDNVWAALDFCLTGPEEAVTGVQICYDLKTYWLTRGPLSDVRRVLSSLVEMAGMSPGVRARGLYSLGMLSLTQDEFDTTRRLLTEALELARAEGDASVVGWSLGYLGLCALAEQHTDDAIDLMMGAIDLGRLMGNQPLVAGIGGALVAFATELPSTAANPSPTEMADRVLPLVEQSLVTCQAVGELWVRSYVLLELGHWHLGREELEVASAFARQGLELKLKLHDSAGLGYGLELLAWLAARRHDMPRAAQLLAGAAVQRGRAGTALATYRVGHERAVGEVRAHLGDSFYEAAQATGAQMSTEEMVAYALGQAVPPVISASVHRERSAPLTAREMEISRLISEGMQTKQIAAKLFISERTVETHVTNIMNKLGLSSRLQVARWVASLDTVTV